jgi:hypothetical protein
MSGLNVEQFVTDAAKSLLGKLAGNFITQFTNSSLSETLASLGNTYETISSLGKINADNVLNGVVNSYFNSSGLNRVFGAINLNPNEYASKIRPETKISQNGPSGAQVYPKDLGPYYMSLHFKKYTRPAPFVDAQTEIVKSIYFPLPRELVERHSTTWKDASGMAADIANVIELGQAGGLTGTVAEGAGAKLVGAALAAKAAEMAAGVVGADGVTSAIEQSLGGSINPNLSLAFGGPTLREMNFSWEFNPNNADESSDLKQILKDIKMLSLPALAVDGSAQFLAYPHIVEMRIHAGEEDDLIMFKQAVISEVSINYAPQGIPSFFKNSREPQFIGFGFNAKEIEYFLSEDFGGQSGALGSNIAEQIDALKGAASDELTNLGVSNGTKSILFGNLLGG